MVSDIVRSSIVKMVEDEFDAYEEKESNLNKKNQ
jgi:hypothetical protein